MKIDRHRNVSTEKHIRCLVPFAKCAVTGKRLFSKKCLKLSVTHRNHFLHPANVMKQTYTVYVDEGDYLLERLTIPNDDELTWII